MAVFTTTEGRREKSKGSQLGKDNNSEPARSILKGPLPSTNPLRANDNSVFLKKGENEAEYETYDILLELVLWK